jgi:hypothetical protein
MMIQLTRKSKAIPTIHRGDVRMHTHAFASETKLWARFPSAADLDSMSGSICS